jgi:uncharacterized protein
VELDILGALLGAAVGLALALTGAGGGVLAVPLLIFGLHLDVRSAAPVGLIAVGAAAAIGALLGLREGIVRYRAAALIGSIGLTFAPAGVLAAGIVPNAPLLVGFSAVLALAAWRSLRNAFSAKAAGAAATGEPAARAVRCHLSATDGRIIWTSPCAAALAITGAVSGLLSGLLGVGGGFVIVPALQRISDVPIRSIVATSQAVIALVSVGAIAAAAWQGAVAWPVALPFASGAVAALLVGRLFTRRLSGAWLTGAFGALCIVVAGLMLARGLGWTPHS